MWSLLLLAFVAGSSVNAACAATEVYDVDTAHSRVTYTLTDPIHTVNGTFRIQSGSIRLDTGTGEASGRILVDAASGESGSRLRDRRMHEQVLESRKYPEIAFTPTHLNAGELAGMFTIHGAGHALVAKVDVHRDGNRFHATAAFAVPFVKWGMKDPSNFLIKVRDQIEITLDLTGSVTTR